MLNLGGSKRSISRHIVRIESYSLGEGLIGSTLLHGAFKIVCGRFFGPDMVTV